MARQRVIVAMSGGVDSSVTAYLLHEQGYDVVGLFMRTGAHEPTPSTQEDCAPTNKIRGCCSAVDAADAQRVADRLNVPFYALNFEKEFGRIKDYFVDEYSRGRTPNPCVVCNTWLKFGKLLEYADMVGAEKIATGHYARILEGTEGPELHQGLDPTKDQSYFLHGLRYEVLQRVLFPIGALPKSEVRRIASERNLGVQSKPDSQEICFVPTGDYQGFIRKHRPEAVGVPGSIVDPDGKKLGEHEGISGFTIGQRKGLGIAVGEPRYVLELKADENLVVIGPRELLRRDDLEADGVRWLSRSIPNRPIRCSVKIRYLHSPTPAVVEPMGESEVHVRFDDPQSAVTPGQAVVFYDGTRVLGGGWIR
jgi:tRNA-specific 2-thiouridylase